MKKDVKQFLLKTWASLNAIFLIFQPLFALPLLFTSAAPQAIASVNIEPESVQLEFDQDTYDFHISVESDQNLSYTLRYDDVSYEEPVSQAVTGVLTSEGTEGVVEAFVFAGTCSGTECVPVDFENGVLQIGGGYEVKFEQSDEYGLVQKNGDQVIYSNLKTDVQYGIEGHDDFAVTFSELPEDRSASLALEAFELDKETKESANALSSVAYDVKTNLEDGTYVYDLELPAPDERPENPEDVAVKYAETVEELLTNASVASANMTSNEVRVPDLDHMTVFVVATPENFSKGWAYVSQLSKGAGTTDLEFVSTRNFYSCFEYRTDGDTSQILSENGGANYNTEITDGLYPYYCLKNKSRTETITANEYVEVRMVFGAEADERFDWTRFEVDQAEEEPVTLDQCIEEYGKGKALICHATSSEENPFNTLSLPCKAIFGSNENSGHFNENGTPTSGHEDDYFGACKGDEEIDLQTISGHKYNSDTKEPIPGWGVTICKLPDDFDSENDNPETAECEEAGETTTDDNGYYEFTELVPGFYKVTEESKEGFVFMTPASGYHVVEAGASVVFSDNNKVLNASFEFPEVTSGKKWNIFESGSAGLNWLVEWTSLDPDTFGGLTRPTNGWLELHRGVNNWSAADGNQYAELDTDWAGPTSNVANEPSSVTISQEISTCEVGSATFDVSFKYSPRPGQANNGLKVMWDDEELLNTTESGVGNSNTVWTSVSKSVTAGPGASVLSFTETGTSDSLGMFVDDVSVVQKSACEGEDPSYDFYNAPVKPDPKPAKLVASKVICEDEKDLPNLSLNKPINASTAEDWVNSHKGCYLAEGWNFQWGDQDSPKPNDNASTQPGFTTFGSTDSNGVTSTTIDVSDITLIKVREVWNDSFIPFTGRNSEDNYSAEMVCASDVAGYDNQEWIRNPEAGATYYCVAFNSPKEQPVDVTMCKEDETGAPLAGWTLGLSKDIGINQLVSVDGSGNEIPVSPADYVVYASGTYRYGNSVMIADAGNSYRPVGIPFGNNNWVSGDDLTSYPGALELMIEGNNINWGLFNSAHTYSAFFPGFTDANISLSIYDDQYTDNLNNGNFSARVEEVVAYGETEENGCVTLEGVKQGEYSVFEAPQTDWAYTQTKFGSDIQTQYPASVTIEEKNEEIVLTNEYRGTGSIEGVKFEDVNANGKNDEEPLLGDWKITLFDNNWNELKNTTTTENGYSFDDLPSGETYYVCEENQKGWTQTATIGTVVENPSTKQDCVEVEVEPREAATASFGNFKQGSVQGRKYPDSNRNGVPNDAASEPWINGWTIRLYEVGDGWTSLGETVTGDTGETGQYKFDNLNPGEYAVCEVAKDGWEQTGPVLGAHTEDRDGNLVSDEVTAIENESSATDEAETCWTFSITSSNQSYGWVQFGNFEFGVIQGRKYLDRNTNGIPNSENEPFLDGWTINLYGMEKDEEEQDTVWTKMASAVTGDTTPEDNSGYVGVPPNADGQFRFENLPAGEYAVCEELPKDWYQSGPVLGTNPVKIDGASTGLDSLAIANESPNAETEGPNCWKVSIDKSGESYGYTMFGNYEPSSIDGFKYFDEDKDAEFEENETGLAGWTITLRNKETEETQTTETSEGGEGSKLGLFSFTGLRAGNYELCEEDRTADGWEQTEPDAPKYSETQERIQIQDEEVSEEETDQETSLRCYDIVVDQSGDEISRNFGNWIESSLLITKTNDAWPNDKQLGDTVKFTLTLQAVGGPVMGVSLTDVPAEHFDYNEGSYEAESSLGPKTVPEPTYASPGTWTVGDMAKDEVVTLSYTTKIKDSADPGIYPDMAWATGTSAQEEARGGENADLMALSLENTPGHYGEETFVGTQVAVVKEEQDFEDYAVKRIEEKQGSVLGASTELPATGANIWTLILAALSVLVGAALIIFGRKKSIVSAIVLCSAALLSSATSAQAATSIRLEEPYNTSAEFNSAAQTKQSDFKVDFVVLNQENLPVTAQCQISKDSGAWVDLSTIYTPKNGGNSGYCEAKSLSNQSSYKFRVVSIANAVTYYSNEVTVGIDKSGPSTPFSYSRYTSGSCTDVIKFKTANDNQTAWVEIYRSEQADSFVAKPDTRIATITIGPDTEGSFNADRPDCNKNYFYAIRAFDANGNASGVIGDTQLQIIIVESADGTSESVANQLGALQVGEGRSFVNGSDASGEDGQEVKDGSTDQENSESASDEDEQNGSVLGVSDTAWFNALKDYALPIVLGIIVLIGFYVLFFYKKK